MKIIRSFSWCKEYDIEMVEIDIKLFYPDNITIWNSYKIKKIKHQREVLEWVRSYDEFKRPLWLQIAEWRTHNLLHFFNYQKDRTKHCDLNEDVKWYEQIQFVLLSLLYFNF